MSTYLAGRAGVCDTTTGCMRGTQCCRAEVVMGMERLLTTGLLGYQRGTVHPCMHSPRMQIFEILCWRSFMAVESVPDTLGLCTRPCTLAATVFEQLVSCYCCYPGQRGWYPGAWVLLPCSL